MNDGLFLPGNDGQFQQRPPASPIPPGFQAATCLGCGSNEFRVETRCMVPVQFHGTGTTPEECKVTVPKNLPTTQVITCAGCGHMLVIPELAAAHFRLRKLPPKEE